MVFVNTFIYNLLDALEHIYDCHFEVLVLCFNQISFLGAYSRGLLASDRGILSWLFVFLPWGIGIFTFGTWSALWHKYLVSSLLNGCFALWLLFPTLSHCLVWLLAVPGRDCLCRLAGVTNEWIIARRKGWRGRQERTKQLPEKHYTVVGGS